MRVATIDLRRTAVLIPIVLALGCQGDGPTSPPTASPASVRMAGKVLRSSRSIAVPQALVEILDGPDAGASTRTDASGRYAFERLRPGTLQVRISKEGFASMTRSVSLQGNAVVEFTLAKDGPVSVLVGSVVDRFGRSVFSVRVTILDGPDAGDSVVTRNSGDGEGRGGSFVLDELTPGRVTVRASKLGFSDETRSVDLVGGQTLSVDFRLVEQQ